MALGLRTLPEAKPVAAPDDVFSAGRALTILKRLVGNDMPHPIGSAESGRVRTQIVDDLNALHIPVEMHEGFGCSHKYLTCGKVHNLVARIDGREPGKAVLAASHYDSVAAGPGAADDGTSVAALLEIARILSTGPRPRHQVLLLFDEGEEGGLMGAEAFAASDPLRSQVGAVVNMDARGDSGASRLFEMTGPRGLTTEVTRVLPWPATSSLDTTIYDLLPNDTDLSVFRRLDLPGVNFAFIGEPARYHTPMDDLPHLSPRSVQHQGDNALAAIRAFGEADLEHASTERFVFFDVAGLRVVSWPERRSLPLALLGFALILLTGLLVRPWPSLWTVLARVAMAVVAVTASAAFAIPIIKAGAWAGAFSSYWIAQPNPVIVLMWMTPAAVLVGLVWLVNPFVDHHTNWMGCWLLWAVLAIVAAIKLPGASHLFVVPSLAAGVAGLLALIFRWLDRRRRGESWEETTPFFATLLPALVAGVIWFPVLRIWYEAMGTPMLPVLAALAALFGTLLLPLLAALTRSRLGGLFRVLFYSVLSLIIVCACVPPRSPERPAPLTIELRVNGDTRRGVYAIITREVELPEGLVKAARFHPAEPSDDPAKFVADAGEVAIEPPQFEILPSAGEVPDEGMRIVRMHLSSPRHATYLQLHVEDGPHSSLKLLSADPNQTIAGIRAGPADYRLFGVPPEGIDVELTVPVATRSVILRDVTSGLPETARVLVAGRPSDYVPLKMGDGVVVSRTVGL